MSAMRNDWAEESDIPATGQEANEKPPELLNFYDIPLPTEDDPNELLKHRFLCRGGGMLVIGQTGIGKSAFITQCAMLWSVGREAFGIRPVRPMRVLIIQAENDAGDMAEFREGILRGIDLDGEDLKRSVIFTALEDSRTNEDLCKLTIRPLLERVRPDILILDPALAYLGGEAAQQGDVTPFLRHNINPLIHEFGCAAVVVHHTNKPPQGEQKGKWQATDFAYLGSGSAEWINWARAAVAIRSLGSHDYFELRAVKRGKRLRWTTGDLADPVFHKIIAHSTASICWREATQEEFDAAAAAASDDVKFTKRKPQIEEFMQIFPVIATDGPQSALLTADQIKNVFHDRGWHKDFYKGLCDEAETQGLIKSTKGERWNQILRGRPDFVDAVEQERQAAGTILEDTLLTPGYSRRKARKKR